MAEYDVEAEVAGPAWQCVQCRHWTTVARAICRVCFTPCEDGTPVECGHVFVDYAAGESADAALSAPESVGHVWTEPVRVCATCGHIRPLWADPDAPPNKRKDSTDG